MQGLARWLAVGQDDLVDVDVPPAAGRVVDDFESGSLARELATSQPAGSSRSLPPGSVRPGRGADDLAVDLKIHARLAGPATTPDQEADRPAVDRERRGREVPVEPSPPRNELTSPRPSNPSTAI